MTREQLQEVLDHARARGDTSLAACARRALDGDSLYQRDLVERCRKAHAKITGKA